jgi:hypothetical protein
MEICLFPECKDEAKTRGLCALHYQYAYRLVSRSKTTWKALEDTGKAKQATRSPKHVSAWFLGESHEQRVMEGIDAELESEEPKTGKS